MDRQQDSMSVVSCRATTEQGEKMRGRQNMRSAVGYETVPEYWSTSQY